METKEAAIHISFKDAKGMLEAAIARRGADYTLPEGSRCFYTLITPEGTLHCLVGQGLLEAGIPLPDDDSNEERIGALIPMYDEQGVSFSDAATELLGHAQRFQDDGCAWGEALELAINEVENPKPEPAQRKTEGFPTEEFPAELTLPF